MIYVRRVDILDYCSLNINLPINCGFDKNILAPFVTSLVRHPRKQKLMTKQQYTVPDFIKFFGTPCISHF